jgi:predicted nucleic acid-binding protein
MKPEKSLGMRVAIDTSVLIAWEKSGGALDFLDQENGPFYIPAHAAAEFLIGTHPPVAAHLRDRARRLYERQLRDMVVPFDEEDAAELAALAVDLKMKGMALKWFDAGIAASALAHGDKLWTADSDYDRLKDRLQLIKYQTFH